MTTQSRGVKRHGLTQHLSLFYLVFNVRAVSVQIQTVTVHCLNLVHRTKFDSKRRGTEEGIIVSCTEESSGFTFCLLNLPTILVGRSPSNQVLLLILSLCDTQFKKHSFCFLLVWSIPRSLPTIHVVSHTVVTQ